MGSKTEFTLKCLPRGCCLRRIWRSR